MKPSRAFRSGMMRRSSALITSPRLWRMRLVFWAGALATGVILLAVAARWLFLALVFPPFALVAAALAAAFDGLSLTVARLALTLGRAVLRVLLLAALRLALAEFRIARLRWL